MLQGRDNGVCYTHRKLPRSATKCNATLVNLKYPSMYFVTERVNRLTRKSFPYGETLMLLYNVRANEPARSCSVLLALQTSGVSKSSVAIMLHPNYSNIRE